MNILKKILLLTMILTCFQITANTVEDLKQEIDSSIDSKVFYSGSEVKILVTEIMETAIEEIDNSIEQHKEEKEKIILWAVIIGLLTTLTAYIVGDLN